MTAALLVLSTVLRVSAWVAAVCGAVVALLTAATLLHRTPLVQWLLRSWREDRDEALAKAIHENTEDIRCAVDRIAEAVEEHRSYVFHHLGPNGETKPIVQRLVDLEIAHRIPQSDDDAPGA